MGLLFASIIRGGIVVIAANRVLRASVTRAPLVVAGLVAAGLGAFVLENPWVGAGVYSAVAVVVSVGPLREAIARLRS